MLKSVFAALLVAGAMMAQMVPASANAVVSGIKAAPAAAQSNFIEVRRGGGHRGGVRSFGGGGGRAFRSGGGGMRAFRGGGAVRAFRGAGIRHHHRGHRHRYYRGSGIYFAAPFIYGGYSYSSCAWLRRKAIRTGSRYWWNRYYECRDDYYW